MKPLILLLLLLLSSCTAAPLHLGWDPTTDLRVTSYRLYQSEPGVAAKMVSEVNIPTVDAYVSNLIVGTSYVFTVTAYDSADSIESDPSEPITWVGK